MASAPLSVSRRARVPEIPKLPACNAGTSTGTELEVLAVQPTAHKPTQAHPAASVRVVVVQVWSGGGLRLKPNPFLSQPAPLPPASSLL